MSKKILIIEDSEVDYKKISNILNKYSVIFYPSKNEFKSFSDLLYCYAKKKDDDSFQKIRNIISNEKPDFILLDIMLDFNDKKDRTGKLIKEKLLDIEFNDIPVCYLTLKPPQKAAQENYIHKNNITGIEPQLNSKVLKKLEVSLKSTNSNVESSSDIFEKTEISKSLEEIATKEEYKIFPWFAFISDKVITYLFYIFLFILFLFAPTFIIYESYESYESVKKFNIILIAENSFLAFLPFLIVCGFYIFYLRSLRPYFIYKMIEDDDFESSSVLLNLTKKLFISSIISYIIIKIIEEIFINKTFNTLSLITFGSFLLMLMSYFVFLDKKKH